MLQLNYYYLELSTCVDCTLNYKMSALMQDELAGFYLQQTSSRNGHAFHIICHAVAFFFLPLESSMQTNEYIQHSCFSRLQTALSQISACKNWRRKSFSFEGGYWDLLLKIIFLCLTWYRERSYQRLDRAQCTSHTSSDTKLVLISLRLSAVRFI